MRSVAASSSVAALLAVALTRPAVAQPDDRTPQPPPGPDPVQDQPRGAERPSHRIVVPTLHGLGLMTAMRLGEAVIWPDPFADTNGRQIRDSYRDAYTRAPVWDSSARPFEWDGDRWPINAIGHGLFGSELYMRARTCGQSVLGAFAFTAAGSALWEYGFEANAVRPSGLDLWYTPVAGLALGQLRYWGWKAAASLRRRPRRAVRAILDPLGELERAAGTPC